MSTSIDKEYTAEIHCTTPKGKDFKLEAGFDDLESAKRWVVSKIYKNSGRWYIERWGELVLEGE